MCSSDLWLARHGVKVDVSRQTVPTHDIGAQILSRAADLGVDMIVSGAYGHSRVRELMLGGVTVTGTGVYLAFWRIKRDLGFKRVTRRWTEKPDTA